MSAEQSDNATTTERASGERRKDVYIALGGYTHGLPACDGAGHCDGPSFQYCHSIGNLAYCNHTATASDPRDLADAIRRILASHREEPGEMTLAHVHQAPECDGRDRTCDPETRVACYPLPGGEFHMCVHLLDSRRQASAVDWILGHSAAVNR